MPSLGATQPVHSFTAPAPPTAPTARAGTRTFPTAEMGHGEQVTSSGAWHIRPKRFSTFRFTLDTSFADALAAFAGRGTSLLDVGAGIGRYVQHLRMAGVEAHGVDGIEGVSNFTQGLVQEHDLVRPFAAPCRQYDVVSSLEVGEHIPFHWQHDFLSNVNCSCHPTRCVLLLSWAPPGQYGSGHINTRHARELHWALTANYSCVGTRSFFGCEAAARTRGFGFRYDWNATMHMRARTKLSYMRANLMVFRRRRQPRSFSPDEGDSERFWQRIRAGRLAAP